MYTSVECMLASNRRWSFQTRLTQVVGTWLFCLAVVSAGDKTGPSKYASVGALPPGWQLPLLRHGDRLQKPGKERVTLAGTVTRAGGKSAPFQLVHELPNSIRYQEQGGSGAATIVFDGDKYGKSSGAVEKADSDLVEALAYDSPLNFLYAPLNGLPVRKLGSRFRTVDKSGKIPPGAVHDVYLVRVPVLQPGKLKQQTKFYHVNSDTQLIERVNYQDADAPTTKVEVVLSDWMTVSNNAVPQLIRRLENGVEVWQLKITAAVFGPSVADGAFQKP